MPMPRFAHTLVAASLTLAAFGAQAQQDAASTDQPTQTIVPGKAVRKVINSQDVTVGGEKFTMYKYVDASGQVCQQYVSRTSSETGPQGQTLSLEIAALCDEPEERMTDHGKELFPKSLVEMRTLGTGGLELSLPVQKFTTIR